MPNTIVAIGASWLACAVQNASQTIGWHPKHIQCTGWNTHYRRAIDESRYRTGCQRHCVLYTIPSRGNAKVAFSLASMRKKRRWLLAKLQKARPCCLQQRLPPPEMEIDRVTTPEGCTIAGLNEMEHQGLSSALIKGIVASFEKD